MNVCCFLCGENPSWWSDKLTKPHKASASHEIDYTNPRPYPLIKELDSVAREIDVAQVVCRTCMKNGPIWTRRCFYNQMLTMWNSEFFDDILKEETGLTNISKLHPKALSSPDHKYDHLTTNDDETLIGSTDSLPQIPPMLALAKFHGPLAWDMYNDSAASWTHPTSENPHEIREYVKGDLAYRRDFTDSGLCCWGCLQPLGSEGAIPTVLDVKHVQGLFHTNGRCALKYLVEYDGDRAATRATASKELWVLDFGMSLSDCQRLKEAPDRRLLQAFGGILTLAEFLEERNVLNVRESWVMNYPYYARVDSTSGLEELQYVDASTHELQPFDKNLAPQVKRVWHPFVANHQPTRWKISHSLLTIEYPDTISLEPVPFLQATTMGSASAGTATMEEEEEEEEEEEAEEEPSPEGGEEEEDADEGNEDTNIEDPFADSDADDRPTKRHKAMKKQQ